MLNKFFVMVGLVFLLASCETASQKAVSGSASATSESSSKADSVKKGSSLFAKAKETASDKLISVGDRVYFGYDSAELSNEAKQMLDKQSRFLRANADLSFTIEGHCDERGTREYNLALGERRANAAKDYLMTYGISSNRISVLSYGKERPVDSGSNPLAWSKNRRSVSVKAN